MYAFHLELNARTPGLSSLVLEIALILAWKLVGWYGLERYLLPFLGTPWAPGRLVQEVRARTPAPPQTKIKV
jgi:thiosulfate dehydrogenase [quinone] large subunit